MKKHISLPSPTSRTPFGLLWLQKIHPNPFNHERKVGKNDLLFFDICETVNHEMNKENQRKKTHERH